MIRPTLAVVVKGLPPLAGQNPEMFISYALHKIPNLLLLSPVQFLVNHPESTGRIYGVFATGVEAEGLALAAVESLRSVFKDTGIGSFVVQVADLNSSHVFDEAHRGYQVERRPIKREFDPRYDPDGTK